MPDAIMHNSFGKEVLEALPYDIKSMIDMDIYEIALNGPDDWEMYRFWCPMLKKGINGRHHLMHREKTGEFLLRLLEIANDSKNPKLMFSYWAGYICHYELDSYTHPYIIARTGKFDKDNPETYKYRGNHMAFEHELDKRELNRSGCSLSDRPLRKIYEGKSLPVEMKDDIDKLYHDVYGWDNTWELLNEAHKDTTMFQLMIEDRKGMIYWACRSFLKNHPQYTALTYYKTRYQCIDVENSNHQNWTISNMVKTESFIDLRIKAKRETLAIIQNGSRYLMGDIDIEKMFKLIRNRSYIKGNLV